MSRIQRHSRVASDFSIARILADDHSRNPRKSRLFVESVDPYTSDNGEIVTLLRTGSHQSKSSSEISIRRQENVNKNTKILDCTGRDWRYIDNRQQFDINNSPFTNFTTTSDGDNISTIKSSTHTSNSSIVPTNFQLKNANIIENNELSWLQCTRYRPPKLARKSMAGKNVKRRPGTHPRIPFTANQLQILEDKYRTTTYLSRRDVIQLSTTLRLPHSRVKIWFQNRRARDRRESAISDSTILSNSAPSTDKTQAVSLQSVGTDRR